MNKVVKVVNFCMQTYIRHPFHLVQESPWPLIACLIGFSITSAILIWFHSKSYWYFLLRLFLIVLVILQWWRDVRVESGILGYHTELVETGLRYGIKLFIVSEVLFFARFFWAFFHASLSPNIEVGGVWPPSGIYPFNKFGVPLLNTRVLLRSGVSVTWSHHSVQMGKPGPGVQGLVITVLLGAYFTFLQAIEYLESPFSIADRSYGRTFFLATGFHGAHVIIGTTFLLTCLLRLRQAQISPNHHFSFVAAIWYWHFVDVVWLFLYFSIYWWGRGSCGNLDEVLRL